MFAFAQYMQHGNLIFPFGLYKFGLFIAILLMLIADRKKPVFTDWLAIGWSVSLMLTSRFVQEFFISEQRMGKFLDTLFNDYLYILFCLLFGAWAVIVSFRTEKQIARVLSVFFAVALTGCLAGNLFIWAIIPLIGWLFSIFQTKDRTPLHFQVIILFSFFYVTAWTSGFYWGALRIISNM